MKSFLVVLTLIFCAMYALAQDPVKVAPGSHKVLLENDHVRVYEFHAKPGDKVGMHSHPNHIVYFITEGNVKFTTPDGKATEVHREAGTAGWVDATTHAVENIGKSDAKAVIIELKDKKAMEGTKKK